MFSSWFDTVADMREWKHFPARDVPPFAEYVKPEDLVVGEIYFRVSFLDHEMLVPQVTPLVFAGRDLDPENSGAASHRLFFQDYASYIRGDRWGMDHPPLDGATEIERFEQLMARGWFETTDEAGTTGLLVFDKALDVLLSCYLRRPDCGV